VTTVTDVMILNYAVGLDVTRDGTQYNTQGVWPCKLSIYSLPLQILAMKPDLMEDLRKHQFSIMMMIAFITFKSSLVPLFEGL